MKDIGSELSALVHLVKTNGYDHEFYVNLQKLLEDSPEILTRCFYEAILQIGDLSVNPFSAKFGFETNAFCNEVAQEIWGDIPKIRINQLNGVKKDSENEFISLTDLIKENFPFYSNQIYMASYNSQNFSRFIDYIHTTDCYHLRDEITKICTAVYQGLPLFKKTNDDYLQVADTDPDFVYIFMNGYYENLKTISRYPKWILGFHFKNSQLEIHKHFFDGFNGSDEALKVRRTAFRKAIGEEDVFSSKPEPNKDTLTDIVDSHSTKLLKIQKKVLDRFYGTQFDITNRDTWTNQSVIVDWLITEFNLSKREAEAIDLVTRPDAARGK